MKLLIIILAIVCPNIVWAQDIVPVKIELNSAPKTLLPKLIQFIEILNGKTNASRALLVIEKDEDFREIVLPEKYPVREIPLDKIESETEIKGMYKIDESSFLVVCGKTSEPITHDTPTSIWLKGEKSWYCFGGGTGMLRAIEILNIERAKKNLK